MIMKNMENSLLKDMNGHILVTSSNLQVVKCREQPADLVGAAIYFASDESDLVTGQSLVIDGGMSLH